MGTQTRVCDSQPLMSTQLQKHSYSGSGEGLEGSAQGAGKTSERSQCTHGSLASDSV